MGAYDAMISSVGGMSAQSNALANTGQNIANVSTVGYKRVASNFETLAQQPAYKLAAAGGVKISSAIAVTQQGTLQSTSSSTDLAVNGRGMFVVSDGNGNYSLTRSGSFVPDASGNLVNSAGFYLMGYSAGGPQGGSSLSGTQMVNVGAAAPASSISVAANGTLSYQLASGATVSPYTIPLATVPGPQNLTASTGNVFSLTAASGTPTVAAPGAPGFGTINAGQLEQSTVDVATEMTNMIVQQRGYQANSETFKMSSDLMKTLTDLNIS